MARYTGGDDFNALVGRFLRSGLINDKHHGIHC